MSKGKLSSRLGDEIPIGIKVAVAALEKDNQRLQNRVDFLNEQNTAQQEENQRMRDALKRISKQEYLECHVSEYGGYLFDWAYEIAADALQEQEQDNE